MISRVKNRYFGLSDYLEFGIRKDSIYERDDKDNVIPLFRDLDTFRKAEEYCVQYKNWNKNYEHITIAFSDEDIDILYAASEYERINLFKSIVIDMIKHRTSGYDLDYEIISYAEYHEPKIKKEEKWNSAEMKKRRGHIHIGISLLNALSNTQVATAFYNNKYMSETIDRYMAKKHNLTTVYVNEPNDSNTDIKKPTLLSITREKLIAETKDFRTREELFEYFHEQGYKYDFTNKNSKKYSTVYIIYEDSKGKSKRLNLQGKTHFRNIDIIMTDDQVDEEKRPYFKELETKSLKKLGDILDAYYKRRRFPRIDKRRSMDATQALVEIYNKEGNTKEYNNENAFISLQAKIFYKHYSHLITSDLKGYYIDTKKADRVTIENKNKNIKITDFGSVIKANTGTDNLFKKVQLMLYIAIAKEWNLATINITGNNVFKAEAQKQIKKAIKSQERELGLQETTQDYMTSKLKLNAEKELEKEVKITETDIKKAIFLKAKKKADKQDIEIPLKGNEHPLSELDLIRKEHKEKLERKANIVEFNHLKMKLRAETILAYAAEKYKLDPSQYEITADNKIINLNNRQKSKKVIDLLVKEQNLTAREVIEEVGLDVYEFLRKEIHLTSREAIREASKVLDNQSIQLNIKLQDKGLELHFKLIEMVKSETYSNIDSKGNFNPYFIINLNKDITQKEAEATLRSKKIEGIVIAGEKGVRVVISLNKPIVNSIKEDEYKELQSQVFNTLDFKGKAIFDSLTKQYKPYSFDVVPISVKGYKFDLSKQQIKAKAIISEKRAEAKVRADTVEELIRTKVTTKNELNIHSFTYIDKEAIMGIDIISLIKKCEKINDLELEERYIIENNFAYDLDSKKILNPYSYMMDNFQGNSEKVARELKNLLDEDFIKTNTSALEEVIFKVIKIAVTDTDISKEIAEHFEVEKCNLDMNKEQFTIEQRTVKFEEIGLTKEKLIESYEANRGSRRITEEDLTQEIRGIHKEENEDKKSSVTIKQGI